MSSFRKWLICLKMDAIYKILIFLTIASMGSQRWVKICGNGVFQWQRCLHVLVPSLSILYFVKYSDSSSVSAWLGNWVILPLPRIFILKRAMYPLYLSIWLKYTTKTCFLDKNIQLTIFLSTFLVNFSCQLLLSTSFKLLVNFSVVWTILLYGLQ